MMTDIEYPNGPWKRLFYGNYDDFDLSIYFNSNGFLISEILNSDKTKSVLSMSQIVGVFGDAETFVESLPRNAIYLLEHGRISDKKYILLLSPQEVVNYMQKDVSNFINNQFEKLNGDTKSIRNIATSYEINLKVYNELTPDMKKEIFANPFSIFAFTFRNRLNKTYAVNQKQDFSKKDMFLGFYNTTNGMVVEPINLFSRTFVFGESRKSLQVLLENFSIDKVNCVIFSDDDSLNGLKYPNENPEVQKKNKSAPFGFPTLNYGLGNKLSVNLSDLPEYAFQDLFGIKQKVVSDLIRDVIEEKQSVTIDNLIKDISAYAPNEKYSSYNINLTARIVNIVKQEKPGVFIGDFSVGDLFENHSKNQGTINIVNLNKDQVIDKLILYNTLKKISLFKNDKALAIFFPNLEKYFPRTDNTILSKEFVKLILDDSSNYFVSSAHMEIDLEPQLLNSFTAKLVNLEENEVAITLKDAKPFRFVLRPTYSKFE